jgi:hypothetical protein
MLIEYAFVYAMGLITGGALVWLVCVDLPKEVSEELAEELTPVEDLPPAYRELVRQSVADFVAKEADEEQVVLNEPRPHPFSEQKSDYTGPGAACWLCGKEMARLPYGICKLCNEYNGVGAGE